MPRNIPHVFRNVSDEPDPTFQSSVEFAATIRADIERWGPVVKVSGFVADQVRFILLVPTFKQMASPTPGLNSHRVSCTVYIL